MVFGSWCCNFIISGWLNAIGVFQDYYSTKLFPDLPTSTIAVIPSLMQLLIFAGVSLTEGQRQFLHRVWDLESGTNSCVSSRRGPSSVSYTTSMAHDYFSPWEVLCTCLVY